MARPGALHGAAIAGQALLGGDATASARDVADASATQRDEVIGDLLRGALVVDVHVARGAVTVAVADEHGGQAGAHQPVDERIVEHVGRHDEPVEEAHAQDALERLLLGQVGQPEHHAGASLGQRLGDAVEEAGEEDVLEEQVGRHVDDDTDDAGAARGQRACREVRAVARLAHGCQHPVPGGLRDGAAVDDTRDRRAGHTARGSHVVQGPYHPEQSSSCPMRARGPSVSRLPALPRGLPAPIPAMGALPLCTTR